MFIRCEGSASQSSGVLRLMWGFLIQGYAGIGPFFIGVFAYFWFMPHDCALVVRGVSEANYSGGYASMEWCSESRLQIFHGVSRGAGVKESLGRRFLDIEE